MKQCPRVPQGFKLQTYVLAGHLPRPGSQSVDEAAAPAETQHVRIFKKKKEKEPKQNKHIARDSDSYNRSCNS